jgi:hypothetical protein
MLKQIAENTFFMGNPFNFALSEREHKQRVRITADTRF